MQLADKNDVATQIEETERERIINAHKYRPVETPLEIYGVRVCKNCEETIEPARLAALPTSVRCVFCQNDFDNLNIHKGKHV